MSEWLAKTFLSVRQKRPNSHSFDCRWSEPSVFLPHGMASSSRLMKTLTSPFLPIRVSSWWMKDAFFASWYVMDNKKAKFISPLFKKRLFWYFCLRKTKGPISCQAKERKKKVEGRKELPLLLSESEKWFFFQQTFYLTVGIRRSMKSHYRSISKSKKKMVAFTNPVKNSW